MDFEVFMRRLCLEHNFALLVHGREGTSIVKTLLLYSQRSLLKHIALNYLNLSITNKNVYRIVKLFGIGFKVYNCPNKVMETEIVKIICFALLILTRAIGFLVISLSSNVLILIVINTNKILIARRVSIDEICRFPQYNIAHPFSDVSKNNRQRHLCTSCFNLNSMVASSSPEYRPLFEHDLLTRALQMPCPLYASFTVIIFNSIMRSIFGYFPNISVSRSALSKRPIISLYFELFSLFSSPISCISLPLNIGLFNEAPINSPVSVDTAINDISENHLILTYHQFYFKRLLTIKLNMLLIKNLSQLKLQLITYNNILFVVSINSPFRNKSTQKFSSCITDSFSSINPELAHKGSSRKKYCFKELITTSLSLSVMGTMLKETLYLSKIRLVLKLSCKNIMNVKNIQQLEMMKFITSPFVMYIVAAWIINIQNPIVKATLCTLYSNLCNSVSCPKKHIQPSKYILFLGNHQENIKYVRYLNKAEPKYKYQ
ncbi:hypothetical protein AGLY_006331 [Aphis glycines]|uniref:Uncharacterized protein n=1 Tax=Aphis glycines TaxID=307491 RepID=A0A6G0TS05_APHGL|nr:hypothetical protein AGLY_006331 [Aphis glycines]